jgi:capsular polysaccharide biosynthesis protein
MYAKAGNWLETQKKIITSPTLLGKAAAQLNLGDMWGVSNAEAASRLADIVAVNQEGSDGVMSVQVDLPDAQLSNRIGRTLVATYEETRREMEEDRVRRRTEALEVTKVKQQQDVEVARTRMLEVMKKNGIVDRSREMRNTSPLNKNGRAPCLPSTP